MESKLEKSKACKQDAFVGGDERISPESKVMQVSAGVGLNLPPVAVVQPLRAEGDEAMQLWGRVGNLRAPWAMPGFSPRRLEGALYKLARPDQFPEEMTGGDGEAASPEESCAALHEFLCVFRKLLPDFVKELESLCSAVDRRKPSDSQLRVIRIATQEARCLLGAEHVTRPNHPG